MIELTDTIPIYDKKNMENKTSDLKSFNYLENGEVMYTEFETIKSTKKLDPGSYVLGYIGYPRSVVTLKINDDFETAKPHNFSDKDRVDDLLESFFNKNVKDTISSLGFTHKVGILLHGIEGGGKTTIIKYYCNKLIKEEKALVFHIYYKFSEISNIWEFVQNIRRIQNNPIIVVFDEFDEQMDKNEAYMKSILDGNLSIHNSIFFAATNHLNRIPKTICERPSRFKYTLNIEGMQVVEDIKKIINPIVGKVVSDDEINIMANELKGKTLDYIKQYCFDKIMDISHHKPGKKKIGFTNGNKV